MSKKLNSKMKRFWGFAEVGEGVIINYTNAFFAIFLTDITKFPLSYVSIILMITSIGDFLLATFSGAIISGTKPKKWGRLRSWLLICSPIVIISNTLQFVSIPNKLINAIIVIVGYLTMVFAFNLQITANVSLIPCMTKDHYERSLLSSNRMMGSNIGRIISGYTLPFILAFFVSSFGNQYAYSIVAFICAVILSLAYYVHFKLSDGYETDEDEVEEKLSGKQIIKSLVKNPPLIAAMTSDLTSNIGSFLLPSLATYIYTYIFNDYSLLATHMLMVGIGGMCGSYISRFILKKLPSKRAVLIIYPFVSIALFSSRFFINEPYMFILLNTFMQFCVGMTQPIETHLYMDTIVYNEWRNGTNSENATSFIMSMMTIPIKVAIILKSAILSFTFAAIGYTANGKPSLELQQGLINAYTIIPALIPLIGWITLKFFYRLDADKVAKMKEEIKERKRIA